MSAAIAKVEKTELTSSTGLSIAPMIERILTDASLPMERVEQAFSFYQKVQADEARKAYTIAFAKMQPSLPAIERRGKSHNGKYARWEDIAAGIMPVLQMHGFGLSFRLNNTTPGTITVTCVLSHEAGHAEETSHTFPYDNSGGKNAIQAVGSAKSYGQRYTATALLGIATRDEDDDGNVAGGAEANRDDLIKKMEATAKSKGVPIGKILERFSVEDVSDMTAKQINTAIAGLMKTRAA